MRTQRRGQRQQQRGMEGPGAGTRTGHLLRQIIHPAVRTVTIEMLYRMLGARRPPWSRESEVKLR